MGALEQRHSKLSTNKNAQYSQAKKYSVTNFKFLELFSLSSPMYCAPPRERRVASARLQANSLVFALHFEGQMSAKWVTVKLNWTAARLTHILMNKFGEFSVLSKAVEGLGPIGQCSNVSTTPITAMGCRQCLPLSVVQLKGKHCRKHHCRSGSFWLVKKFQFCDLDFVLNCYYLAW